MDKKKLKIEVLKDLTVGKRLEQARKSLSMSQEDVSKKLYLNIDIIRQIEEDLIIKNIDTIFLNGYIRSYAKLVNIPKKEINFLIKRKINNNNLEKKHVLKTDNNSKEKNCKIKILIFILISVLAFITYYYYN
ncbi:MAG: helix-turn-helix domain-containing protein [Arsenophonus sp.]|nr:MAG: helix-turn-helix domain-containing protein [Arsenophonus sp.]